MRSVPVPPCLRAISALVLLPFATTTISAQSSAPTSGELTRTRATFPDYRNAAGRMVDGVWRVHLTAHEVAWHPRGENGPELVAYAFSADGGEPQVPAPMIPSARGLRSRSTSPMGWSGRWSCVGWAIVQKPLPQRWTHRARLFPPHSTSLSAWNQARPGRCALRPRARALSFTTRALFRFLDPSRRSSSGAMARMARSSAL